MVRADEFGEARSGKDERPGIMDWAPLPPEIERLFDDRFDADELFFRKVPGTFHIFARKDREEGMVRVHAREWKPRLKPLDQLTESEAEAWHVFYSGALDYETTMRAFREETQSWTRETVADFDPVWLGRDLTLRYGRRLARDGMARFFELLDDSKGQLECHVKTATLNPNFVVPGSIKSIPETEKAKWGFQFILGFRHGTDRDQRLARQLQDYFARGGFSYSEVETHPYESSAFNRQQVRDQIRQNLEGIDHSVIFGFSKGAIDFIHAAIDTEDPNWDGEKIRYVLSVGGTLRPSYMAHWVSEETLPIPSLMREGVRRSMNRRQRTLRGIRKLGSDSAWTQHNRSLLSERLPNVRWISALSLPEGEDGLLHEDKRLSKVQSMYPFWRYLVGPADGVTESGGSVLPPGTGVEQWIIKAYASHLIITGNYPPSIYDDRTVPVSSAYCKIGDEYYDDAGRDIIDVLLRVLPAKD